jgi:hypothetical protein
VQCVAAFMQAGTSLGPGLPQSFARLTLICHVLAVNDVPIRVVDGYGIFSVVPDISGANGLTTDRYYGARDPRNPDIELEVPIAFVSHYVDDRAVIQNISVVPNSAEPTVC